MVMHKTALSFQVFANSLFAGVKRVWLLLFLKPTTSFTALADVSTDGVWQYSYTQHVATTKKIRAITSIAALACATIITQFIFALSA